jgi:hypothetical protein
VLALLNSENLKTHLPVIDKAYTSLNECFLILEIGLKSKLIECVSLGKGLFSILRICKFETSAKNCSNADESS